MQRQSHCRRAEGQGTPQSLGQQPLISRLCPPLDTPFTSKGRAGDAWGVCSRSPQQLQTPSPHLSSPSLALASSFPETSFHANPPLPLLIPGEFTRIRTSAWGSQPHTGSVRHVTAAGQRGRCAAGTPVPPPLHCALQMLWRASAPQPGSSPSTGGKPSRWALPRLGGQARAAAARHLPGPWRGRALVTPNDSPFSCLRPSSPETPTHCQQLQAFAAPQLPSTRTSSSSQPALAAARGTALPSPTSPEPFANPHRRENTRSATGVTL